MTAEISRSTVVLLRDPYPEFCVSPVLFVAHSAAEFSERLVSERERSMPRNKFSIASTFVLAIFTIAVFATGARGRSAAKDPDITSIRTARTGMRPTAA